MKINHQFNAIQGLRGIAIICVVVSHIDGRYELGSFGTAIFLGIMGFICAKKQVFDNYSFDKKYILIRILRFYPLYLIAIVITGLYFNASIVYGVSKFENMVILILNLLMIHTLIPEIEFYGAYTQVGWFIPLVFLSILLSNLMGKFWRKMTNKSCVVCMILASIGSYTIATFVANKEWGYWLVYISPYIRLFDCFMAGCVYLLAEQTDLSKNKAFVFDICAFLSFFFAIFFMLLKQKYGYFIYYSSFIWLIPTWFILFGIKSGKAFPRFLAIKPIVHIGNISFELFMLHFMIFHFVDVFVNNYVYWYINGYIRLGIKILTLFIVCELVNKINKRFLVKVRQFI